MGAALKRLNNKQRLICSRGDCLFQRPWTHRVNTASVNKSSAPRRHTTTAEWKSPFTVSLGPKMRVSSVNSGYSTCLFIFIPIFILQLRKSKRRLDIFLQWRSSLVPFNTLKAAKNGLVSRQTSRLFSEWHFRMEASGSSSLQETSLTKQQLVGRRLAFAPGAALHSIDPLRQTILVSWLSHSISRMSIWNINMCYLGEFQDPHWVIKPPQNWLHMEAHLVPIKLNSYWCL